ncbi:3-oxoacyl-ACP synthase [Acidobacteria bacterium Mor1]|nr:3-oxoacyl-ACP synthase [Acidobacteria bacterium Mor1]
MPRIDAKVTSVAKYVPERVVTNADMEALVQTNDEWIRERTGIRQRHFADPGTPTSSIAYKAAMKALEQRGLAGEDLDLIVVGTITPDMVFPSTACVLQEMLGAKRAWGFDLSAACSAFVYAMTVAAQFVGSGSHKRALAVGADVMTSILDMEDRATCVLFGDGAGAAIVEPCEPGEEGILDFVHDIDGSGAKHLYMPAGGSRKPTTEETARNREHFVRQDGRNVFKYAVRRMTEIPQRMLERNDMTGADLDLLVPHQANARIISAAAEKLGMPSEKVMLNIDRFGNTTAGTIPIAMSDAVDQGKVKKGDSVMLLSVGAGFTTGCILMRWAY